MEKVTLTREQARAVQDYVSEVVCKVRTETPGNMEVHVIPFPIDEFAIITDVRKICPSCLNPVWDIIPEQKKKLVFTDNEGKEIDTTGMKFEFKVLEQSDFERLGLPEPEFKHKAHFHEDGKLISGHCCDSCKDGHKCESE